MAAAVLNNQYSRHGTETIRMPERTAPYMSLQPTFTGLLISKLEGGAVHQLLSVRTRVEQIIANAFIFRNFK